MPERKLYIARTPGLHLKAVLDIDCLPSDVVANGLGEYIVLSDVERFPTARRAVFYDTYRKMKWLEDVGMTVCIDFGDWFYETGGKIEGPHSRVKHG